MANCGLVACDDSKDLAASVFRVNTSSETSVSYHIIKEGQKPADRDMRFQKQPRPGIFVGE
jgi:hypothetical protein